VKHLKLLTSKTEKECFCVYVPCVFLAEEEKFRFFIFEVLLFSSLVEVGGILNMIRIVIHRPL